MSKEDKKFPKEAEDGPDSSWSVLSLAWELGYMVTVPLVLFALGGRILDKRMDSSPWMLLLGILLSITITSFLVYKKTIKVIKDQ